MGVQVNGNMILPSAKALLILACVAGCSAASTTERPVGPPPATSISPASAAGTAAPPIAPANPTPIAGAAGRGAPTNPIAGGPSAVPAQPGPGAPANPASAPVMTDRVLPCAIKKAIVANCSQCHGATPVGGAPMPLTTWADFQQPAKQQPNMKVVDLVKLRINDKARPMPPGGTMSPSDLIALNEWINGGTVSGDESDKTCDATANPPGEGLTFDPLVPLPGETCYDFPVHAGQTLADKTEYPVKVGEHYVQFYFAAPWPTGTLGTRYGGKYDNKEVIHHWLLFGSSEFDAAGTWREAPLPTLLGVNAQLLGGWAVGGANMVMPDDVGFELPPNGATLNIQWHYYNNGTAPTTDGSAVQVCTVPPGSRPNVAGLTWVGTEDLNGNVWFGGAGMPAHRESTFQGTCRPSRRGLSADQPIKIIGFWPHMHQLGTRMQSIINRKNGTKEMIFDKPFDFNYQVHYMQQHELMPGDTLTAICHFNNTTDRGVPFGESSDTEMCYNFTFSYPAHALENGVVSLIGATNTCW